MLQVYLASGWFNETQKKLMQEIYDVLCKLRIENVVKIFAPYYNGVVVKPGDPREKWEEAFHRISGYAEIKKRYLDLLTTLGLYEGGEKIDNR